MATLRTRLLGLLRVPPEPRWSADPADVRVFRAAPAYFRYRQVLWAVKQAVALIGLVFGLMMAARFAPMIPSELARRLIAVGEVLAWVVFLTQLVAGYLIVRLDFELRWYVLSDRSLRIREGIVNLREKTMTFANIQQITIRENPLQRMLGIADVHVRTAGGGGSGGGGGGQTATPGESAHEAFFRGVDNAEEIRAAIRDRVRRDRGAGRADAGEAARPPAAPVVVAARELGEELRALRSVLAGAGRSRS